MASPAIAEPPSRPRERTFETLLVNPRYRRFYLGQGISLIGTWLQASAVNWVVFDLTRSEWWLGITEAANLMPGLFVGLLAGALADHLPSRRLVLITILWQMMVAWILAALFLFDAIRIWHLILFLALARVGMAFEMPARQVFLYQVVGRQNLGNAIALNVGLFQGSRVIGPSLVGVCLVAFGRPGPFVLNALTFLGALFAVLSIRIPDPPKRTDSLKLSKVFEAVTYLGHDRRIAILFGLMTAFGVLGMGYNAMLSAFAREIIETDAIGYSILQSSGGVGAILGVIVVASLSRFIRRESLIVTGISVFAISLLAASTLPGLVEDPELKWLRMLTAMCALLGAGFGAITFYSTLQTLIQLAVPDHYRGRIMGVWMVIFSASVPSGALLTGRLAGWIGLEMALLGSGLACAIIAIGLATTGFIHRPRSSVPSGTR